MSRRLLRILPGLAALTALVPLPVAAQRVAPAHLVTAAPASLSHTATPHGETVTAARVTPSGGFFSIKRLTAMVGGSALGAGLGYFSSQVRMSDWDDKARSEQGQALRRHYAWGGAAAGATLGLVLPIGRAPSAGELPGTRRFGRTVIFADEIGGTGARNAFEAVQTLRPRWLVMKEVLTLGQQLGEGGAGRDESQVSGDYAIIVYMDAAKLGGIETLRNVALSPIRYIRFYNATEATYRWGRGHAHGVIYLSTADDLDKGA